MTDAEIKNLRDLMRAATPGPLTVMARNAGEQCVAVVNQLELVPPNGVELAHEKADADFLAAAVNALPGLLDEVERLRCDGFDSRHPAAQNLLGRNARLSIALDIVRDILADDYEPTPITAEHWAPIHDQVQSVVRERDELREEAERLRADAARYRWLRDPANANADEWNLFGPYSSPKEVDAAIDAAMKEDVAPGKDPSPMADEAPYEERCATKRTRAKRRG